MPNAHSRDYENPRSNLFAYANVRLQTEGNIMSIAEAPIAGSPAGKKSEIKPCEIGVCGSCVCSYREGTVIHRDAVLSLAERQDHMTPCVSRARVSVTLDL